MNAQIYYLFNAKTYNTTQMKNYKKTKTKSPPFKFRNSNR